MESLDEFIKHFDIFGKRIIPGEKTSIQKGIERYEKSLIKKKVKKRKPSDGAFGKSSPNETQEERANRLAKAYKIIDNRKGLPNDIEGNFIYKNIFSKTCFYCGEKDWKKLGCDRIDNSLGHLESNVVCCCYSCNLDRNTQLFEDYRKKRGV